MGHFSQIESNVVSSFTFAIERDASRWNSIEWSWHSLRRCALPSAREPLSILARQGAVRVHRTHRFAGRRRSRGAALRVIPANEPISS
jgi:hypothetical protein